LKTIVDYFLKQGVLFKSLKEVDKILLNTRKKVFIYMATDIKGNYHSIFKIEQKSRFLIKNSLEIEELDYRLQRLENHNFKYKHLIIGKAICSKASNYLKERGWDINHDLV
jgi:hypothetical protein